MPEKIVHVSLRVPEALHRKLSDWADLEHRSLHGQILRTLEGALEQHQALLVSGSLEGAFATYCERRSWQRSDLAKYLGVSTEMLAVLAQQPRALLAWSLMVGPDRILMTRRSGVIGKLADHGKVEVPRLLEIISE